MSDGGSFDAETHDWVDVDGGTECVLPFQLDAVASDADAASQHATTSPKLKTAYEQGVVEGERRAKDNAQQAYFKGYRAGCDLNEEKVTAMYAQCNARIKRSDEQHERTVMRLEADLENSRRDAVQLENYARAERMVMAMTATHHACMNTLRTTVEHYKQQWEDKVAEGKYLRAQVEELKEEVAHLAAGETEAETASELSHGLRAQIERQKETIICLRKQVSDALNARPEDVAKMAKERDAAVTLREGTRNALALANQQCSRYKAELPTLKKAVETLTTERNEAVKNEKYAKERLADAEVRACELEKQIGPLKEDQEVVERNYAASRDLLDRLQTDYYAEQAKVAQLCEQLRVAVRDHEATKSHHKSLIADTSDAVNELRNVRRELEVEKGAAGELKKELEEAKAELARCQALTNVNHEKWQWAKEDGRAQLRAKMAEVCELRDKVGAPEKDVRQLTHELQTARGTLEARENMLAQVKEELATERLTSAELERQRDEVLKRITSVNETATRQSVRAEEVEKERDALKEEAEGRSVDATQGGGSTYLEVLQAQLKEKTEQIERQKATIATYRKAQADFHDAHAKERRQLESERNSLKETVEIACEQCRSLQSDIENRDAAIAVLRKKVAEVEGEARALSIERDAAVTQREGTCAAAHARQS